MPKFGELQPADPWSAATRALTGLTGQPRTDIVGADNPLWAHAIRTLTGFAAQDLVDLPIFDSNYNEAQPAVGGAGDAFGAWVEISADIGIGKRLLFLHFRNTNGSTNVYRGELQIGEGAVGSESAVARVNYSQKASEATIVPVFKALSDNARISVRAKDDTTGTDYLVHIMVA